MTQPSTAPAAAATVSRDTEASTAANDDVTTKGAAPDSRTPAQIEAQLEATRARLAGRIDDLQAYVTPKAVLGRQLDRVRLFYVDEFGGVRPERVLATVGVVAAVVGLGLLRRRARR